MRTLRNKKKRVEKQLVRDWRDKTIFWVGNYDASLRTFCRFFQSDWRDKGRGFEPARDTSELVFPFFFLLPQLALQNNKANNACCNQIK